MMTLTENDSLLLAQGNPEAAFLGLGMTLFMILIGFVLVIVAASVAFVVWVYYTLFTAYDRIPQPFRLMEPWQIFLLLIPLFNIVWVFFVFLNLPKSFERYFHAQGRYDQGDCGYALALWSLVLNVIGCGLVGFILQIIFLVKMSQLKKLIPIGGEFPQLAPAAQFGMGPPHPGYNPPPPHGGYPPTHPPKPGNPY